VVGDPEVSRVVLTDPSTTKPHRLYENFRNVTGGPTILTTDGPRWHSRRKATAPAFSSNHVRRMTSVASEKTQEWINDLAKGLDDENSSISFDVGEEMRGIILGALSETAFEYAMSREERSFLGRELRLALVEYIRKTPANPLRPYFGRFSKERRRAALAVRNIREIVITIMTAYRNKNESNKNTDGTIIQLIMDSEAFPNDEARVAQLIEFLLVGHDTTSYNIGWILLLLAKHPEEQKRLRECLYRLPPQERSGCEYLKRVVKEGMRLFPVARSSKMYSLNHLILPTV